MNRPVLSRDVSLATDAAWKRLVDLDTQDIAEWRDLASRALEPNSFLDPEFSLAALKMADSNVGVVLVRDNGLLTGFFPGEVEGIAAGRAVNTFVAWTHPFAPLGTPLVDRNAAAGAIRAFLHFLPSVPGAPRLALMPLINESGNFARAMSEALLAADLWLRRFGAHERAAFSPSDEIALSGKKLKELRRQRRRLEEEGALVFETIREPARINAALGEYLALEGRGWKGRGGSAAQNDPITARFVCAAVNALCDTGKARIDLLRLNDLSIAAAITLYSGNRGWFWKISYDENFARHSPGVQLTLDVTESLRAEKKIALVDSCAAAHHPMINHLWARRIQLSDWLIPLSGQASFAAGIVFESARRFSVNTLKAARGLIR